MEVALLKVKLVAMTKPEIYDKNGIDSIAAKAASVCFGKRENYTMTSLENSLGSGHDSVVEHVSFMFYIEGVSRSLMAQLTRSRIATFHVESQRYVRYSKGFEYIVPESIKSNEMLSKKYYLLMEEIGMFYKRALGEGIPAEDARMVLPNACTTNIMMTMNARELKHFFNLRCCTRAQWEIRELANKMLAICKKKAPIIFSNAGAMCEEFGVCKEKKSCGKVNKIKGAKKSVEEYEKQISEFVTLCDNLSQENAYLIETIDKIRGVRKESGDNEQ